MSLSLSPHGLKLQEQVSVTYGIVLPQSDNMEIKNLLDPAYWKHHANRLRPGDKVEVRTEGNLYYAELFVVDAGHAAVKMRVLSIVALENSDEAKKAIEFTVNEVKLEESPGYTIGWVSPTRKFGVKRDGHKDWVRWDFTTKEEARKWAMSDLKAMAA